MTRFTRRIRLGLVGVLGAMAIACASNPPPADGVAGSGSKGTGADEGDQGRNSTSCIAVIEPSSLLKVSASGRPTLGLTHMSIDTF